MSSAFEGRRIEVTVNDLEADEPIHSFAYARAAA